jgi:hypothetical protein
VIITSPVSRFCSWSAFCRHIMPSGEPGSLSNGAWFIDDDHCKTYGFTGSIVLGVEPFQRRAPHPAQATERLTRPLPEILWRLAIEQSPFGSRIDELIAEKPLDWDAIAKALQIVG